MATISSHSELAGLPVGKIVAVTPATARVFEQYQIDYCCKGNKTLGEACHEKKLDPNLICAALEAAQSSDQISETNWAERGLGELCEHIVQRHHAFLREELPRVSGLIEKVVNAHGQKHVELAQVKSVFRMLRAELEPHMEKEEQILFPAVRILENSNRPTQFPFGTVCNPIRCLEHEHEGTGEALAKLRELTGGYTAPADACPTYRVMLDSLARLERDLHEHIFKENQILFPRAKQLESKTN